MQRVKLRDREMPKYTRGEEIFNMVSHIIGGGLGIAALVLCIIFSAIHKNVYGIVSSAVYGSTMILLYTMSSIYHGLKAESTAKKVFQILDHCSIFLLIAGSYTPIALCSIRLVDISSGWIIFGIIWGMAILGITLNAIDLNKYKVFSMICYLVMGWIIIFKFDLLFKALNIKGIILLISGGIIYTIGAILYGFGRKYKYMHSIFHLTIVLGSLLQFLCILLYII